MMPTTDWQLQRIQIKGFKSIREADVTLRPLNILVGANGSGKSNFIQTFRLLNEIIEGRLQVFSGAAGANNLLHYGSKTTPQMSVRLLFGRNGYQASFEPSTDDTLIFAQELCWYHHENYSNPYRVRLGGGHSETKLFEESRKRPTRVIADYVIAALQSWKVYHFHDTSASASVKQSGSLDDNARLRPDAANLAAFLYRLRETEYIHYERIVQTIRLVAPFFDDFVLRPSPLNRDNIRLEWREKGSDAYFNAHMLSDGTLRFMCLTTLLLQPELPSLVLIDEPELGLHPYAITLLAGMLRSATAQTQVIVSTQSVPFVNQFEPEDMLVTDREGGQSIFRRLEREQLDQWLDEYGVGELWEKNLIGGRPQPWIPAQ